MDDKIMLFLFCIILPMVTAPKPGEFFWKPRLALDLAIPTTEASFQVHQPNKHTIQAGLVVMIDGYAVGITVIGLAAGLSSGATTYPHLNPKSAFFYTSVYRWALRYLSLIPFWLSGNGGNFVETHKTWKRRYYYMDEFMPKWMRKIFPYVDDKEWGKEELEWKRFKKYAESAFGKHYRKPQIHFNDFKSLVTRESIDSLGASSTSVTNEF